MKIEGALKKRDMNSNFLKKGRRWSNGVLLSEFTAVLD